MKRKGDFKVKNVYNYATEQVEGEPVYYKFSDGTCEQIATLTYADKDYIYGYTAFDSEYDIEGIPERCLIELVGDIDG